MLLALGDPVLDDEERAMLKGEHGEGVTCFDAAAASSGGVDLFHVVGATPEAVTLDAVVDRVATTDEERDSSSRCAEPGTSCDAQARCVIGLGDP